MSAGQTLKQGARNTAEGAADSIKSAGAGVARLGHESRLTGFRDTVTREATRHDRGQVGGVQLVGVMFAIILAAAIGMVGTKVISEIQKSITSKNLGNTADANQTLYENSTEAIGSGFANAMSLTDIVFLVLMFVVIIGALFLARSAGSN